MENYPIQIQPNHADHISYYRKEYLEEMFAQQCCIAQAKYDGERMLIHFYEGQAWCTSRRYSKKTNRFMENQDKLPILQEFAMRLYESGIRGYTVLDCEFYSKNWATAVGVLHSLPERAIALQKENEVKFAVFDCVYFDNNDIREKQYIDRLEKAIEVIKMICHYSVHLAAFITSTFEIGTISNAGNLDSITDIETVMQACIDEGFEGAVIKSLSKTYYEKGACLKAKKFETVDCVVIDYQQGRGKYANTVGALLVGYYDKDANKFVQISHVNCSTDEERDWWRDNWKTAQYSVIEVKCQEVTDRSLRHPVYIRRRDDKDYTMCTKETIFKFKKE